MQAINLLLLMTYIQNAAPPGYSQWITRDDVEIIAKGGTKLIFRVD